MPFDYWRMKFVKQRREEYMYNDQLDKKKFLLYSKMIKCMVILIVLAQFGFMTYVSLVIRPKHHQSVTLFDNYIENNTQECIQTSHIYIYDDKTAYNVDLIVYYLALKAGNKDFICLQDFFKEQVACVCLFNTKNGYIPICHPSILHQEGRSIFNERTLSVVGGCKTNSTFKLSGEEIDYFIEFALSKFNNFTL